MTTRASERPLNSVPADHRVRHQPGLGLTGAWYLARSGNFAGAFMLGLGGESVNLYQLVIGIGAWLGTIMPFNVWVLIWPSQKKVLGVVLATDEQKAAARTTTLYATRANFILSVPLVLCMGSAAHGLPF